MGKTLVILDFDGTVSPILPQSIMEEKGLLHRENYEVFALGYDCAIRRPVLDFLQKLSQIQEERDDVIVRWVSSWDETTQMFSNQTEGRIPHFDYLPIRSTLEKGGAIAGFVAEQGNIGQVIVFEDDPRPVIQARQHLENKRVRWMRCEKHNGITDEMITEFWNIL